MGAAPLSEGAEFRRETLVFPRPSVVDDALFAVEAAVVSQADDVRVRRQVDDLEQRVQTLEAKVGVRVQRLVERLLRRRTS